MAIPADADHVEAGHIIMNEIASEETQAEFATEIYQVPVREDMDRPEVTPGVDELEEGRVSIDQLEEITGSQIDDVDWGYIGEQSDNWTQRWNEEIEAQ